MHYLPRRSVQSYSILFTTKRAYNKSLKPVLIYYINVYLISLKMLIIYQRDWGNFYEVTMDEKSS